MMSNYLSEEQLNFLRNLTLSLEGQFEFAVFKGRHETNADQRNGIIFDIFGDKWIFYIAPASDEVGIDITEDGYSCPDKGYWRAFSSSSALDIENITKGIYDYYFEQPEEQI
ncbi:MAG: hypothetical protein HC831_21980 [Chloroflexia bacterium]|nr:hypothetical protein [Chloroflexia bacterium]